jgi:mono/diheme cytochrome c family protein
MSLRNRFLPTVALAAALVAPGILSAEELGSYDGPQLYKRLCASCHGPDGAGDGPVAATLRNRPPDLAGIAARRGGQFPEDKLRQIIDGRAGVAAHGQRDMPVWGNDLKLGGADPDAVITRLIAQLRSMQKPSRR